MSATPKPHISRLIESGDRVTPIFRKTGTIMLGADAFSRAEDIEQAVYHELPRLVEQLEATQRENAELRELFAQIEAAALNAMTSNPAKRPSDG